jgi:hypothetical protein
MRCCNALDDAGRRSRPNLGMCRVLALRMTVALRFVTKGSDCQHNAGGLSLFRIIAAAQSRGAAGSARLKRAARTPRGRRSGVAPRPSRGLPTSKRLGARCGLCCSGQFFLTHR